MGFGLIFVGYATLLAFRAIPIEIIGFFLIYMGAESVQRHEKSFGAVKLASAYMFFESVLGAVMWFSRISKISFGFLSAKTAENAESLLYHCGLAVFHFVLCRAVIKIASQVGYSAGVRRAKFSIAATAVFYAAQICVALIPGLPAVIMLPMVIFQLLWLAVNLVMLYGCFAMIVTPDMLEKEEKKYNEYLEKHRPKNVPKKDAAKNPSQKKYKASKK